MNKKEHIYQIYVRGISSIFGNYFKAYSKKVYKHYPSEEEINEFVTTCQDNNGYIDCLEGYPTEIKVIELDVIE